MPFTPTHVLAIIPIFSLCRVLPFSALAIGTLIPDFPMFLYISSYDFSHSILGIAVYCVPAGFVMHWLFERLIKPFSIDFSPAFVRSRLTKYRHIRSIYDFKNTVLLTLCFAIGSFSHIAWDSFTHDWGWGVTRLPILQQQLNLFGYLLPHYKLIQYGSTIVGLPLLLLIATLKLLKLPVTASNNYSFSPLKVVVITCSFLILPIVIFFYHSYFTVNDLSSIFGYTIKQSIGAGIVLLTTYSLIHAWLRSADNND